MRNSFPAFALSLAAILPGLAGADTLQIGSDTSPPPATLDVPKKGQTERAVLKTYGQPRVRHATVGGDSPKHPPITRWDYAGFSVIFERNHVVDAVVPDHPAPVYHTDQLKPAQSS